MATRPIPHKRPSGVVVLLAFGIAIAATSALIAVALLSRSGGSDTPTTTAPVVDLTEIPQEGNVLGDPRAKVTVIEYADLQCPACRLYAEAIFPGVVNEYVRTGRVKAEFRGFPFLGQDSLKAQQFVVAAGLQNRLWNLQEALYRNQGGENEGWVTDDLLRQLAADIPGLDVSRLVADAETDEVAKRVEDGIAQAEAAGVPGTPTFFIQVAGGKPYFIQVGADLQQFRAALDDAIDG